ncbi:hypothetical protein BVIET440_320004 [Burkholderia vietnamiensis]
MRFHRHHRLEREAEMLHPASNRKRYSRTAPHPNSINTENPSAIMARCSSSCIPAPYGSRKNVGVLLSAPTTSRPILFTFLRGTKGCPFRPALTTPNQRNGVNDVVRGLSAAIYL